MGKTFRDCPRCSGPIPNPISPGEYPGSLSRVDGETEICTSCGHDEAMAENAGFVLTPPVEPVKFYW